MRQDRVKRDNSREMLVLNVRYPFNRELLFLLLLIVSWGVTVNLEVQ